MNIAPAPEEQLLSIHVEKDVEIAGRYDVVVCGGGPAGWVAAVAAAREGCSVALVEKQGSPGGMATAGLVTPISGFYKNGQRVVGGIPWEFVGYLLAENAARIEMPKGHISFAPEYYKLISARMLRASGADFFGNSYLSGAVMQEGGIAAVLVEGKSGSRAIAGACFVDATGDGDLCVAAGAPTFVSPDPQPATLCFTLSGVDTTTPLLRDSIHHDGKNGLPSVHTAIHEYLSGLRDEGRAPTFGGPWFNTLVRGSELAVNITRRPVNALDSHACDEAEYGLREDMFCLTELLRRRYAEFRNCDISSSAVSMGVRESRHLAGAHVLTGDELVSGVGCDDGVALAAHPMDIHLSDSTQQLLKPLPRVGYIPFASMVTHAAANLVAAGRLISADENAYASVRVQGTAMATGQAAGTAAAMCAKSRVRTDCLCVPELRRILMSNGAIL